MRILHSENTETKMPQNKKQNLQDMTILESLFNPKKIPEDAKPVLEEFDSIIQGILPLNSKQLSKLPDDISELSHQLTDERSTRKMSYMNSKIFLSAYARYFMWWNLIRLVKLFSNISFSDVDFQNGDSCLDIGSGPLTVVTALWLSHPELRSKKLHGIVLIFQKKPLHLEKIFFFLLLQEQCLTQKKKLTGR